MSKSVANSVRRDDSSGGVKTSVTKSKTNRSVASKTNSEDTFAIEAESAVVEMLTAPSPHSIEAEFTNRGENAPALSICSTEDDARPEARGEDLSYEERKDIVYLRLAEGKTAVEIQKEVSLPLLLIEDIEKNMTPAMKVKYLTKLHKEEAFDKEFTALKEDTQKDIVLQFRGIVALTQNPLSLDKDDVFVIKNITDSLAKMYACLTPPPAPPTPTAVTVNTLNQTTPLSNFAQLLTD